MTRFQVNGTVYRLSDQARRRVLLWMHWDIARAAKTLAMPYEDCWELDGETVLKLLAVELGEAEQLAGKSQPEAARDTRQFGLL